MDRIETFEDFLKEKHAEEYMGLDDNMPDAFDGWLGDLDAEEWMDLGEEYGQKLQEQFKKA